MNHRTVSRKQRARREAATAYALLSPAVLGVGFFLLVPIVVLVWLTFHEWNLLNDPTPVGFTNWVSVFEQGLVWRSFGVTTIFVLLVIPTQTALGIWFARLLIKGLPGSPLIRTVLVLPWVCAPLVLGVVWEWILRPTGALAELMGQRIEWLSTPWVALAVVAFVSIWSQVGYVTLFFMAGMSSIPKQVIEAARIDGASEMQIFWRIIMPLIQPTTFFVLVTSVIASFQAFDLVYALSPNGGPQGTTDLIAARIYFQAIDANNLGEAGVLALILFAILIVVTLAQNAYFNRRTTYER